MGTEILAIIAGIILHSNPDWFNSAYTVGTVCMVYGIVVLVLELILFGIFGGALIAAVKGRR